MLPLIEELIGPAVSHVFGTMLNMKADMVQLDGGAPGQIQVSGSIGFTGTVNFVIYLTFTEQFARAITCRLLGLQDYEIEGQEMVHDAIGEMTNMVAGYVKTRLCDKGQPCAMTVPTVVRGREMTVSGGSNSECRFIHFKCKENDVTIQVILASKGKS